LGLKAKISKTRIDQIIDQTKTAISSWQSLASQYGVSKNNIRLVKNSLIL
jgi:serine/threonine-protein kinase HipA